MSGPLWEACARSWVEGPGQATKKPSGGVWGSEKKLGAGRPECHCILCHRLVSFLMKEDRSLEQSFLIFAHQGTQTAAALFGVLG